MKANVKYLYVFSRLLVTQVMLSVLSLFILFPVVFHVALVYKYFYL